MLTPQAAPARRLAARAAPHLPSLWERPHRRLLLLLAALALAQAVFAGLTAVGVRWSFQALHGAAAPPWPAFALIACMGLAIALARWAERVKAEELWQGYAHALRQRLFVHVARLPHDALVWQHQGHLNQRLVGDMGAVRQWVARGQVHLMSASITLPTVCLLLAVWIHPLLVSGVLALVCCGLLAMWALSRGLPQIHRQLRRARARLTALVNERLPHAQTLRVAGRLSRETRMLDQRAERVMQSARHRQDRTARLRAVAEVVRGLGVAWVLGASFFTNTPASDAAATLAAIGLIMPALRDVAGAWDQHAAWVCARHRLHALLSIDAIQTTRTRSPATAPEGVAQTPAPAAAETALVRLREVSVGPLRGVSLSLHRGTKVVVEGAGGSGKSSLLRLLGNLALPQAGRVHHTPPPRGDQAGARRTSQICFVDTQSPVLSGSLRRALTLNTRTRPGDDSIAAVALGFGLRGVMERLGGLDGRVAESGNNLSRSERHRLLLARAALSDADLVLVDDLDELVDDTSAEALSAWLLGSAATVVYVSQHAARYPPADEIWHLNSGQLAAQPQGAST